MTPVEIGAASGVAAVLVTILSGIAILIFNAGRHSQRLDRAEGDIKEIRGKQDEHAQRLSVVDQLVGLVQEVRDDVKELITGKITPARRRASGD